MVKTTLKEFEASVIPLIRKRIMEIKKPFTAERIAAVNHEDNFILYFARDALDVIVEEFMLLDELKSASNEIYEWFNKLPGEGYLAAKISIIRDTLKKIYAELR